MAALGHTNITLGQFITGLLVATGIVVGLGGWGFSILREDIAVREVDGALRTSIGNTEQIMTAIKVDVSYLKDKFSGLDGQFKNVDTRLEAIDNRLTTMEVRIDTFSQQLQEYRRDPNFPQPIPTPQ